MKTLAVLIILGLGLAAGLTVTFPVNSSFAGTQDCKAKRTC